MKRSDLLKGLGICFALWCAFNLGVNWRANQEIPPQVIELELGDEMRSLEVIEGDVKKILERLQDLPKPILRDPLDYRGGGS